MIVIKSKQCIDGTGNVIKNGVVIIKNNIIADIGEPQQVTIPEEADVIDCTSKTVLPGFIDSHTHVCSDASRSESITGQFNLPEGLLALRAYVSLQKDIQSGVTTMRCLGDPYKLDQVLRDAIKNGEIPGPRLLACVHAIKPSHGTALNLGVVADGPKEVRKKVREAISNGADVIKLFVSNLCRGRTNIDYKKGDLTEIPAFTKEEIAIAVEEAHRAGIKVAAHGIGGPAVRWAIEVGVDSIEHANMIQEEDIELFVKCGTFLSDPNLQLFFDNETGFEIRTKHLPNWWHEKVKKAADITREVHKKALKAGVKYVLATDSNHGNLWREAFHMVNVLGATEMEAILAITKNGAEVCGIEDKLGTLEKGKIADITIVDGNPLKDIIDLRKVILVIKDGCIVYNK